MMYKNHVLKKLLSVMIVFIVLISISNAVVAQENNYDENFLFIYDNDINETDENNISSVVDLLTYLGYSVKIQNEDLASEEIPHYNYVIYYHKDRNTSASICDALSKSRCKVMTFGSGDMSVIIKSLSVNLNSKSIEEPIEINYELRGNQKNMLFTPENSLTVIDGEADYSNGSITTNDKQYPLVVRKGRYTNIAVFSYDSDFLKAVFSHEIATLKWPYDNVMNSYAQYIVIGPVYPYYDPSKIQKIIDLLKYEQLPFVISVSPIYQNGDYPAMRRFCEVLSYAQANSGAIILMEPKFNKLEVTVDEINKAITQSYKIYSDNGIYPIGLQLDEDLIHDDTSIDVMKRFSTIFLQKSQSYENKIWTKSDETNLIIKDGHRIVSPILTTDNVTSITSDLSTAVYIDPLEDINSIENKLERIKTSTMPLHDLLLSSHVVYTDDSVLNYSSNKILFNQKEVSFKYQPYENEENFDYKTDIFSKTFINMDSSNKKLLIVVTIISIIFVVFIILARIQNRSKFVIKKNRNCTKDNKNDE